MHNYRENNVVLDIKDFFFHLFYRWKSILLAALIGAFALGGYQYLKTELPHLRGQITLADQQYEEDLKSYREKLAEEKKGIEDLQKSLETMSLYKENSLLYAIDPMHVAISKRSYYVRINPESYGFIPENAAEDPVDYVISVYVSTAWNQTDAAKRKELFGTDELFYFEEVVTLEANYLANSFTLSVMGKEENQVSAQADYLAEILETVVQQKAQEIAPHTLVPISTVTVIETDESLSSNQKNIDDRFLALQKSIEEKQKAYDSSTPPSSPGRHLRRYAAIGFLIGGFAMLMLYAGLYLFGGKLHTARELTLLYSLPLYGDYANRRANDKLLSRLFDKWEFRGVNTDPDVTSEGIAALLRETCKGKNVLLTGTVGEKQLNELQKRLQNVLGEDVTIGILPDFLNNGTAITEAKKADAVLLTEEKHVSAVKKVERVVSVLLIGKANVIGCIML